MDSVLTHLRALWAHPCSLFLDVGWSYSDHVLPWCGLLCAPIGAGLRGHSGPGTNR